MARPYKWQTEGNRDQLAFLVAAAQLFRQLYGDTPLSLVGFSVPQGNCKLDSPSSWPENLIVCACSFATARIAFRHPNPVQRQHRDATTHH